MKISHVVLLLVGCGCVGGQTPQKITVPTLKDVTVSADDIQISATANSSLPVKLSVKVGSEKVCSVAGTTISVIGIGTCTITASQDGGTSGGVVYAKAPDVDMSFNVTVGKPDASTEVDAVFGLGSLINGKHTDYKVNSSANVLEGSLIGNASPQLLAGASFQLPIPTFHVKHITAVSPFPWHAFVSLKFATGAQTITGYTFGITYRVHKSLDLLAAYALTPFNEPSHGFTQAALVAIASNPSAYQGKFNGPAMNNNVAGAFDGFPIQTLDPTTFKPSGTNIYAGDPLETRYRGGFMIGVAVPISLKGILSGSGQ